MTPKFTRTTVREKETLGERLAKKRAALGYDIKEAERATRIRAKYIELLEAGNYEKLPPDVYVRGFLKNYANFLKLDPEKVITIYAKERGLKENVKKITEKPKEEPKITRKREMPKIIVTPKRLIISGALLTAFLIVSYIGWQVSILAAPPKLEVTGPGDNVKVEEESLIVEGKTDPGSDVFINDIPIGVDPEGTFKEKISVKDGVNLIKVTAKNKLNKETQITRTVLAKLKSLNEVQAVQNEG